MDDLIAHIKSLAPIAEAIVYLGEHSKEIEEIEDKLESLRKDLTEGEARLAEIAASAKQHTEVAEQAKASVIEAKSKLEQMVEASRHEANRLVGQAKAEADTITQRERIKFKAEEIKLRAGIEALNEERQALGEQVELKRKDHDAVQASINSLKARLDGRS